MKQIKFKEWNCTLEKNKYSNGRIALSLKEVDTHEPIADVTVNVPEINLAQGHILIKDYSENTGMTEALLKSNVIAPIKKHYLPPFNSLVVEAILLQQ